MWFDPFASCSSRSVFPAEAEDLVELQLGTRLDLRQAVPERAANRRARRRVMSCGPITGRHRDSGRGRRSSGSAEALPPVMVDQFMIPATSSNTMPCAVLNNAIPDGGVAFGDGLVDVDDPLARGQRVDGCALPVLGADRERGSCGGSSSRTVAPAVASDFRYSMPSSVASVPPPHSFVFDWRGGSCCCPPGHRAGSACRPALLAATAFLNVALSWRCVAGTDRPVSL